MRQCQCGGIVRQHQLTGDREAWTCNACGRYEAVSSRAIPPSPFEHWFAGAIVIALQSGAPDDYVWSLEDCDDWRAMFASGMTAYAAVQAVFNQAERTS